MDDQTIVPATPAVEPTPEATPEETATPAVEEVAADTTTETPA